MIFYSAGNPKDRRTVLKLNFQIKEKLNFGVFLNDNRVFVAYSVDAERG